MNDTLKFRPSILNIGMIIWILIAISLLFYTNDSDIDQMESGRGVLQVFYLVGIGMIGIIIDILLQRYIQNKMQLAIVEGVLLLGFIIIIFL